MPTMADCAYTNKSDLRHLRSVQSDDAKSFCEGESLSFIETSALDATNVEEAFENILTQIYKIVSQKSLKAEENPTKGPGEGQTIVVTQPADEAAKKKSCC